MVRSAHAEDSTLFILLSLFQAPKHVFDSPSAQIFRALLRCGSDDFVGVFGHVGDSHRTIALAPQLDIGGVRESYAFEWSADYLRFSVREPFVTKVSQAGLVFGQIDQGEELIITSQMPKNGVIFSDGIEADYLQFNSGRIAHVGVADKKVRLVVPAVEKPVSAWSHRAPPKNPGLERWARGEEPDLAYPRKTALQWTQHWYARMSEEELAVFLAWQKMQ